MEDGYRAEKRYPGSSQPPTFLRSSGNNGTLKPVPRTQGYFRCKRKRRLINPLKLESAAIRRKKRAGVVCGQTSEPLTPEQFC